MAKAQTGIQVMTANRLSDGLVVFLDTSGAWTESLGEARIAQTPEQAAEMERLAAAAKADNIVVDQYLIDVAEDGGALHPVRLRERLRLSGPTVGHSLAIANGAASGAPAQKS